MTTTYELKALTETQLRQLCVDVKQTLVGLYGDRLEQLMLYGSYARGDFHAESDVDFLVVLRDEVIHSGQEVWFMGNSVGELSYRYDLFISVKPTSITKFKHSDSAFYEAVRTQGKLL